MPSPDDPATDLMVEHLASFDHGRMPLIVGDAAGGIANALEGQIDCRPASWMRFAGGSVPASSWPPSGAHSSALVRLPKGKEAQAFALGAVATVLEPGAPVALFGMNDEGIRSASSRLAVVCEPVSTLAVGHHARILTGRSRESIDVPADLGGWRKRLPLNLAGIVRDWMTFPGLFASGRLDEGTALLVAHLPPLRSGARVLDYGCGTGIVAAHVREAVAEARLDLLDADALALVAADENVPGAGLILGTSLSATQVRDYDLIISNPPIHDGVTEDRRVLGRLIEDAPRHLVHGGMLQLVVQRRVPVAEALSKAFGNAQQIASTGQFSIFRAVKP